MPVSSCLPDDARGLTGAGFMVAVLDTGIKADHPDLTGRIAEFRDFTDTARTHDTRVWTHGRAVAATTPEARIVL